MSADPWLQDAATYAAREWPVFPLGRRTKRPVANCNDCPKGARAHDPAACPCLCCHGFYAASTDLGRITAMRAAHPRGLLAIRTGAASDLLVVDIDPRHGGAIIPELMPPTACVATGNGGWHLYYRHPGETVVSRELPGHRGVDIKADGGYVTAPPSIHPDTGRPYVWVVKGPVQEMAPRLVELARTGLPTPGPTRTTAIRTVTTTTTEGAGAISYPDKLLDAHLAAVQNAPVGRRRRTLYGAARGVARMVAAGALDRDDARRALTDVGRTAEQTDRQIQSAIECGFRDEGVSV